MLLLFVSVASVASSSEWIQLDRLEALNSQHGLPHNWTLALHQDREGFLWVGTSDGLSRYDGYGFKNYGSQEGDVDALQNDFIVEIEEAPNGDLWVATGEGLNRFVREQDRFEPYPHDDADPQSLASDRILDMLVDSRGRLWVSTMAGLERLDPESRVFQHLRHDPDDPSSLSDDQTVDLHEGSDGRIFVLTWQGILNAIAPDTDAVTRYPLFDEGEELQTRYLAEDDRGRFWIGVFGQGILRFDPATGERKIYEQLRDADFNELLIWHDFLWVATDDHGIYLLDLHDESWRQFRADPDLEGTLSDDRVMTFLADHSGVLWIGTDSGIDKFVPAKERFRLYRHHPGDSKSLSGRAVWPILEDHDGELWVGTTSQGLNRLNRQREVVEVYTQTPSNAGSISLEHVTEIFEDRQNRLWIASRSGFAWMDESRTFQPFEPTLATPDSAIEDWVYKIEEDASGILWISGASLWRLDPETMELRVVPLDTGTEVPPMIYSMDQDTSGALWLGLSVAGLIRFDPQSETFSHFLHDPENPNSLSYNEIGSIFIDQQDGDQRDGDQQDIVWVGTQGGGLNRFDPSTETFRRYGEKDGLPNDHVNDIIADLDGFLWMSTNKGLSRFDPATETFRNYDVEDGLQGNVFYLATAHRSSSGELFFGGPQGLTAFFPHRLIEDPLPPKVAITDFLLFNESTPLRERLDPARSTEETPHLVLGHRDSVIGFEFSALHFANPGKNRYVYRLEGVDPDWVQADSRKRFAQYTNLKPGDYLFQVKASQQDGVWNHEGAKVRLTVLPPPWKTWWAYLLYSLALAAIVIGYVMAQARKIARERAINQQLRKVDKMKDEFLANTSHELRTPLYGIIGLAESMIDGANGTLPEDACDNLSVVAASGKHLSKLVEDMLDFSKLSRSKLELDKRPVDLRAMADIVLTLSRPLVGSKKMQMINNIPADLPRVAADEDRLQQVFYNLIGNAIKFTESGSVELSARVIDDERVEVQIKDTGIGIAPEHQERIFESFEQLDASTERSFGGTGLGLALTKALVQLHGGSLRVESELGEGATFLFTLPTAAAVTDDEKALESATDDELSATGSRRVFEPAFVEEPTIAPSTTPQNGSEPQGRILVVDDEPVNRLVLINQLTAAGYQTTEASSGFEALRLIEETSFDLILLDIMMPRMSGFEVCQRLREQHPIERLPIIFLTAKNQVEDQVTGFHSGANDYLTKPVTKNELLARVETHLNILQIHRQLNSTVHKRTEQLKTLSGLLPICGLCKRIRDDQGYWNQLEAYLDQHSEATLTHGICPDCVRSHYAEYAKDVSP